MDAARFAAWTRRRFGLAAGGALATLWSLAGIASAPAKKNKQEKLKFNEFGCVDVGGKCRGNDANCCSNICEGKKPKKGKKDKSRCVGHDEQGCRAGQKEDGCGGFNGGFNVSCTTSSGDPGLCNTTTGNAGYCAGDGACVVRRVPEGRRLSGAVWATGRLCALHGVRWRYRLRVPRRISLTRILHRLGIEVFQRFFAQVVAVGQESGLA
jgi:hypothetical protein